MTMTERNGLLFRIHTAVNVATSAIDRVHTTAEAHNRVMVVEVMGRDSGWIALYSGIRRRRRDPIPEKPFDLEEIAETIRLDMGGAVFQRGGGR